MIDAWRYKLDKIHVWIRGVGTYSAGMIDAWRYKLDKIHVWRRGPTLFV